MKKLLFLLLMLSSVVYSESSLPENYDPNEYRNSGCCIGLLTGLAISRLVIFKSIHNAFKTHPITSPYQRFAAKSALVFGYVVISSMAAEFGAEIGDCLEDKSLTSEQQLQKYASRFARSLNDWLKRKA